MFQKAQNLSTETEASTIQFLEDGVASRFREESLKDQILD